MARDIDSSLLTALTGDQIEVYYAVEMLFDSDPIRLWTGIGDKTILGEVYTGAGNLLSVGGLAEVADLSAAGVTITLSGIPSQIVSLALQEPYQGRVCNIYLGEASVSSVVNVFSGYMNQMPIEDSGESSSISLLVDSKLVTLNRRKERRYTHESQKQRYPTDTFFSFVDKIQDKQIPWGKKVGDTTPDNF